MCDNDGYVQTSEVRKLKVYFGGHGVFYDKEETHKVMNPGVAVSVLHNGKSYEDDLNEDSILYHYPVSETPGRDKAGIAALKNAHTLEIPLFVVDATRKKVRKVHWSYIADFDDDQKLFEIKFADYSVDSLAKHIADTTEHEFECFEEVSATEKRLVLSSSRDSKFKFRVRKRYGVVCSACNISELELIDAAHIVARKSNGTNDVRNGLPLCANHHRALDSGMIRINPSTLRWVASEGLKLDDLNVTRQGIEHLRKQPAIEALRWRWENRKG